MFDAAIVDIRGQRRATLREVTMPVPTNLIGETDASNIAAVRGTHKGEGSSGVFGEAKTGPGVSGASISSVGVDAKSQSGPAAVRAIHAGNGPGVLGVSKGNSQGVHGVCEGDGFSGVFGESATGPGVSGSSTSSVGVDAKTENGPAALRAVHAGGGVAGLFGGDVRVTHNLLVDGDVQLTGADLAEQFGVVGQRAAEPGSVVVLVGDDRVRVSDEPYDHRVAGIVSGAGSYRPGIVLDRQPDANRCALALSGKVWCKVDADCAPVEVGDMLTTSPTPGHAMRATDPARAFGAVVGKALGSLKSGRALVPVLVALQ
jgi:hypothetical protein